MSMVMCKSCDSLIDSDYYPEGFINMETDEEWPDGAYICTGCQDTAAEAEYYAELERGYAKDRI